MEFDNLLNQSFIEDRPINYRAIIDKYLYYWKWFLLSAFVFLIIAFIYLRYTPNQYNVSATILIDDKENGMLGNEMSAFADLGIMGNKKTTLETEITVLQSRTLISKSIKNLRFNVTFADKGKIESREIYYKHAPFKISFLSKDSLFFRRDTSFVIYAKSASKYILLDREDNILQENGFGEVISSELGEMIITPNRIDKFNIGDEVIVNLSPLKKVARHYGNSIEILAASKKSNALVISLTDPIKQKAKDILNELIKQYNLDAIEDKNLIARNTDRFITKRIDDISKELESVDKGVETYKTDNRLTNIEYESEVTISYNSAIQGKIVDLNSQIKLIDYVLDYMEHNKDDLIPSNLGLKDQSASQSTLTYNQLLLERNRIIKGSSSRNPTVINLNEQIATLRESIDRSLLNLRSSLTFSLQDAKAQENRLRAKRAIAPRQEREFQDIKRRQQIIESLYLYLLQKREENAITLAVPQPKSKVIDLADGSDNPVSPKGKKIYILFCGFGLIIPFMVIFIGGMLDNKIHTKEDIEYVIDAPILGDIPHSVSDEKIIIEDNTSSDVAESFRMLRTNVNFVLPGLKEVSKSIFVTSSIGGEGKTVIAINFAISLSLLNKKVLIIGADVRKPKLGQYLNLKTKQGLTSYLADSNLKVKDLVQESKYEGVHVIPSGEIPPNPSELLTNGRFNDIMAFGRENYDYVVVDTAPINVVTDTLLLANNADLFIYVIRVDYLEKNHLKSIRTLYENKRLPNMGLLLNDVNYKKKAYGYGYGYGY